MRFRSPSAVLRSALSQLREINERQTVILDRQSDLAREHANLQAAVDSLALRLDGRSAGDQLPGVEVALARQLGVLRAIFEDEPAARLRLWAIRDDPEYARPYEEENPLVTIVIPTYSNAQDLENRSIPSVLGQSHDNLEVLVVGDAAGPEIEEVVRSFDDPRLRYVNLTIRGPYPADPVTQWCVTGTNPTNEGLRLAKGQWIGINCDDDAFSPKHVELLLGEGRRRRLEIVYGRIRQIDPQGGETILCTFPPQAAGEYGVQASLLHRGLRMFPRELEVFGDPGDWAWIRRMIRLGVRIGMINEVVVDYFPSNLWGTPSRLRGTLDSWHP
jgi:hypothetical protein